MDGSLCCVRLIVREAWGVPLRWTGFPFRGGGSSASCSGYRDKLYLMGLLAWIWAFIHSDLKISIISVPFEWFTLWLNMPFMLLFSDIRQGLFYGMLMSFWIIFTGEHLVVRNQDLFCCRQSQSLHRKSERQSIDRYSIGMQSLDGR